mmetsp:Transcript_19252/g.32671  ORF Transcript_19252/g.32671 Transcript_19252/m.32671 type:complete len:126 (+) Transcript_19252:12-389(+)
MDNQPHVRVPFEGFFDQPPRPGEVGYDSEYTPGELEQYKRQQKKLEQEVYAAEKRQLETALKTCILKSGSMWNAQVHCGDILQEYTRRLRYSTEFGQDINSVVNFDVLKPDWDGYSSPVYTPEKN